MLDRCYQPSDAPAGNIVESKSRLGKRYRGPVVRIAGNQTSREAAVCSVISNSTGRPVFF